MNKHAPLTTDKNKSKAKYHNIKLSIITPAAAAQIDKRQHKFFILKLIKIEKKINKLKLKFE